MDKQVTVGSFEQVSFPDFDLEHITAKIDTGAFSGALHCTDISVEKKDGARLLHFTVGEGDDCRDLQIEHFVVTHIRSATGHRVKRYIIDTTIILQNETYPIRIGLSDRSDMRYPVLIGRRFLRENKILVDVLINQEYDTEGEKTS